MYKEIVTKAVIGKGKKYFKNSYSVLTENNANTILGCWVINHNFKGYEKNNKVNIDGNFDINIWYSYDDDKKTAVASKNIPYSESLNIKTKEGTSLKDDVIEFDIEKELGIEVINEEKVKIAIEDDEEPWDTIEDDIEDVEKKIDDEVKEDFI